VIARSVGEADMVAEALWQRAFTRYWIGDLEGSHRWLLDAYDQIQRTESDRGGKILFWLARSAANRGDFTEAAAFSADSIAAMSSMPHHQSKFFRAMIHFARAGFLADVGDFTNALEEARHANALVRELGLPMYVGNTAWSMGDASLEVGDAEGARRYLQDAADLFERLKMPGQIPEVRARLARAFVQLGDLPRARESAEVARAAALPNDLESRYIAAVALGEVCEAEGDAPAAEALFHEAIAMLERSGMGDRLATARIYYARFLLRQGRGKDARGQLDPARAFYRDPLVERQRDRIDALLREAAARTT
jgi:tetratricopeptide (TPR) repeat protein